MATITVKNIPDDVYEAFKRLAKRNRRSVNSEVVRLLEEAVRVAPLPADEILAETRVLLERTVDYYATDDLVEAWINEGRE